MSKFLQANCDTALEQNRINAVTLIARKHSVTPPGDTNIWLKPMGITHRDRANATVLLTLTMLITRTSKR